jgi:hypothetical protein
MGQSKMCDPQDFRKKPLWFEMDLKGRFPIVIVCVEIYSMETLKQISFGCNRFGYFVID